MAENALINNTPDVNIWGITTFFNPLGYKNKYENYKIFRKNSKRQGLYLLTIELEFGENKFELKKKDADILIQLKVEKDNVLWQKEALMNIALKNLPKICDKVIWIDCDIIFENENWIEDTNKLLDKYKVIQPFTYAIKMRRGVKRILNPQRLPEGTEDMNRFHGIAYGVAQKGYDALAKYHTHGHVGYVWSARREIFDDLGFYDYSITGSGDTIMANAFFKCGIKHFRVDYSKRMLEHIDNWCEKMSERVNGSVYFTNGHIFHLWHGAHENRNYTLRHQVFNRFDFDPEKDIKKNVDGVWGWSSDKIDMHIFLKKYFLNRKEDGIRLKIGHLIINGLRSIFTKDAFFFDRLMGNIGLTIKKISPKVYFLLKKVKDR